MKLRCHLGLRRNKKEDDGSRVIFISSWLMWILAHVQATYLCFPIQVPRRTVGSSAREQELCPAGREQCQLLTRWRSGSAGPAASQPSPLLGHGQGHCQNRGTYREKQSPGFKGLDHPEWAWREDSPVGGAPSTGHHLQALG